MKNVDDIRYSEKEVYIPVYDKFENLPEDKRNRIIQVCIEEFAVNGYDKTSTNTIVKKLGISKGALFLYFKNKKELFLYLMDKLSFDFFESYQEMLKQHGHPEKLDLFEGINHALEYYKTLTHENPFGFMFLQKALLNTPPELKEEIEEKHNHIHELLIQTINMDSFKKDIDADIALDIIIVVSHYVMNKAFLEYLKNPDQNTIEYADNHIALLNKYLDIIKYGVC